MDNPSTRASVGQSGARAFARPDTPGAAKVPWVVRVPADFLDTRKGPLRGLSPRQKLLLLILDGHARNNCFCWARNDTLAAEYGATVRTVKDILGELEALGLIERVVSKGPPPGPTVRVGIILKRRVDPDRPAADSEPALKLARAMLKEKREASRARKKPSPARGKKPSRPTGEEIFPLNKEVVVVEKDEPEEEGPENSGSQRQRQDPEPEAPPPPEDAPEPPPEPTRPPVPAVLFAGLAAALTAPPKAPAPRPVTPADPPPAPVRQRPGLRLDAAPEPTARTPAQLDWIGGFHRPARDLRGHEPRQASRCLEACRCSPRLPYGSLTPQRPSDPPSRSRRPPGSFGSDCPGGPRVGFQGRRVAVPGLRHPQGSQALECVPARRRSGADWPVPRRCGTPLLR